jgi:hypothetical protein
MPDIPQWVWLIGVIAIIVVCVRAAKSDADKQKAMWHSVAQALGGSYFENGGACQVLIPLQQWTATLDVYTSTSGGSDSSSTTYTRLRLPFVSLEEFGFVLMRRNSSNQLLTKMVLSPMARLVTAGNKEAQEYAQLLGREEIKLGDATFDQAFILKSAHEPQTKQLFEQVKGQAVALGDFGLGLKPADAAPFTGATKTMILHYQEEGVVTDIAHLKEVCRLLEQMMQELSRSGVATDQKPPLASPLGR